MNDLVSIVTSFYGESPFYIRRLYNSITKQSVNWEWIITDDFSGNLETVKELWDISSGDPRVRFIWQKNKREIFRDPSLYSTGQYIFHIDADDDVHPLYLEHCLKWFNRFPQIQCILSASLFENSEGKFARYALLNEENRFRHETYLGRVWRSGFHFPWESIFSNPEDIIRWNDKFIVQTISCSGDILFLPRIYIKYTMRADSNTSRERTDEEKEAIVRSIDEFTHWYEANKRSAPYDPFFFGIEKYLNGFFEVDWNPDYDSIEYFGPEIEDFNQRKMRDLFPDFKISFNQSIGDQPSARIIDCSGGFFDSPLCNHRNIIVCKADDPQTRSHYENLLGESGKMYKQNLLWDYIWLVSLT